MSAGGNRPRIAIIGGGLAGLAAAVALADRGFAIELFEARRRLGGRATSFYDNASGEWIDHCQHVSMGCCTNLADFCRRTGIAEFFRRDRILNFFGPDGRCHRLAASRWLPAPAHLLPALLRLSYLSLADRFSIARAMLRLARTRLDGDDTDQSTIGEWLRRQGQSPAAIERFWSVVLVSALGEELDRASLLHARKVFVDGFLSARRAYEVEVPRVALGELYGDRLQAWLEQHGVSLRLGAEINQIAGDTDGVKKIVLGDGSQHDVDGAIVAVSWRRVRELVGESLRSFMPELTGVDQISASPITGVHLWFDREITPLPHAVLVDRLSQWLFNRGHVEGSSTTEHYYQVVISASRSLADREREAVIDEIVGDLVSIWPVVGEAKLLRWRIVTDPFAVFSVRPGIDGLRPPQQTSIPNLALAGDWTRTGWPSTMEGAVRSGYLAAEAILKSFGRHEQLLVPDLKRALLTRLLVGSR